MKFFSREGRIRIQDGPCWKVTPVQEFAPLLRALPLLGLQGCTLYLESGSLPPAEVASYLDQNRASDDTRILGGTLLPSPHIYRLPITPENVEALAVLVAKHPVPIGAIHVHVYRGKEVILAAFDAFLDPLSIDISIPEASIKQFTEILGCTYSKEDRR